MTDRNPESNMKITRNQRRILAKINYTFPPALIRLPDSEWKGKAPASVLEVWRSADYLVQVYDEIRKGVERISVCRTNHTGESWSDGITWDDLQRLKAECGRGDRWAVEIYPADGEVVNVANMRHLWLLDAPPVYVWRTI